MVSEIKKVLFFFWLDSIKNKIKTKKKNYLIFIMKTCCLRKMGQLGAEIKKIKMWSFALETGFVPILTAFLIVQLFLPLARTPLFRNVCCVHKYSLLSLLCITDTCYPFKSEWGLVPKVICVLLLLLERQLLLLFMRLW